MCHYMLATVSDNLMPKANRGHANGVLSKTLSLWITTLQRTKKPTLVIELSYMHGSLKYHRPTHFSIIGGIMFR